MSASLRSRLRTLGPAALGDAELLDVLLGGGAGRGAHAGDLLRACAGSLRRLTFLPPALLEERLGTARAVRLLAAAELGRRASTEPLERGRRLRGPSDIHALLGPRLRDLLQEEFHVLLLDARHCLLRASLVTRGTADTSLVHAREVFREAVREGACAVILVHNHPSGDPRPSPEDRTVTRQLHEAGGVMGIPVLDHVIVGDGRYVSMAEEGMLA
ncbi:MAG TPA: DNA repair protein RadC [Candidatus Thermoplasmatota archaeon]